MDVASESTTDAPAAAPPADGDNGYHPSAGGSERQELDALNQQMRDDPEAFARNETGRQRWMELHDAGVRPADVAGPAESAQPTEPPWPSHPYTVPEFLKGEPAADQFSGLLHAAGVQQHLANVVLEGFDLVQHVNSPEHREAFATQDAADKQAGIDQLRKLWPGDEYERNLDIARSYLDNNLPPGVANLFSNARVNGHALFNSPLAVMKLVEVASRGMKVPPATGDVESDIQNIEAAMRSDLDAFNRDAGLQMRLRALYAERLKRQRRA